MGLRCPGKAYFSMAADKPILYVGDVGSELQLLVSEAQLGGFVKAVIQIPWHCKSRGSAKFDNGLPIPRPEIS